MHGGLIVPRWGAGERLQDIKLLFVTRLEGDPDFIFQMAR
jgi:hypothetical protein